MEKLISILNIQYDYFEKNIQILLGKIHNRARELPNSASEESSQSIINERRKPLRLATEQLSQSTRHQMRKNRR